MDVPHPTRRVRITAVVSQAGLLYLWISYSDKLPSYINHQVLEVERMPFVDLSSLVRLGCNHAFH